MRLETINFQRGQRGWTCQVGFYVTTAKQFTDVYHFADAVARSRIWAFVRAICKAREIYRQNSAKPGEREALGW